MNEWDRLRKQAEQYKANYPSGTRIILLSMGNDPRPIEDNSRGTVDFVDDIGTLHCTFDNGRALGIIPGEDSFRKLTAKELAEEEEFGKAQEETGSLTLDIYQINENDSIASRMTYRNSEFFEKMNVSIDSSKYILVYSGPMVEGETLEDIYARFNINHPDDFRGHSLSVSDVVVVHDSHTTRAYFVDSFGFKEILNFFANQEISSDRVGVSVVEKETASLEVLMENAEERKNQTQPFHSGGANEHER